MRNLYKAKQERLATAYQNWEANLGANHGPYNSSKNEYYWDVAMNLIHCQQGLCAYTEQFLVSPEDSGPINWMPQPQQKGNSAKPEGNISKHRNTLATNKEEKPKGQLEHFDRSLKESQCWHWENLFWADADINTKVKGTQAVDHILNPGSEAYDPYKLLVYKTKTHKFSPNPSLEEEEFGKVSYMIRVLGLNSKSVVDLRKKTLNTLHQEITLKKTSDWSAEPYQFPTAWEMWRRQTAS